MLLNLACLHLCVSLWEANLKHFVCVAYYHPIENALRSVIREMNGTVSSSDIGQFVVCQLLLAVWRHPIFPLWGANRQAFDERRPQRVTVRR